MGLSAQPPPKTNKKWPQKGTKPHKQDGVLNKPPRCQGRQDQDIKNSVSSLLGALGALAVQKSEMVQKSQDRETFFFCVFCAFLWLLFLRMFPDPVQTSRKPKQKTFPRSPSRLCALAPFAISFPAQPFKTAHPHRSRAGNQAGEVGQLGRTKLPGGRAGSKALTRREAQPDDRRRKAHGFFVGFPRCRSAESLVRARGVGLGTAVPGLWVL